MRWIILLTGWVFMVAVAGADVPEGGRQMLESPELRIYAGAAADHGGVAETVPVEGKAFTTAQRLILPQDPAEPWDAGARALIQGTWEKGDRGLLVFEARALPLPGGKGEEAEAVGTIYIEEPLPPEYPKAARLSFRGGPEWTVFYLPFEAERAIANGKAALVFHLAQKAQSLELGPVQLLNYGKAVEFKDLPRTAVTYRGREADAVWRKEALERIQKLRTAPLTVRVKGADGQPVAGAEVLIRQRRNAFGFGSAVTAAMLTAEGPDGDAYRRIVEESFSRVVFENDHKMSAWEESLKNKPDSSFRWESTQKACAWLKQRQIEVRGHYLAWAPWQKWSEALRGEPEKIRQRIRNHIPRIVEAVGDCVMEWDAINHLAGWDKNIDEVTGLEFYTEMMKISRAATSLPLWVNEDQIFRPGRQQEDYYDRIQKLIEDGQKPDGIGNQGHFDESFLPSPQEMLANSDRFSALVPALQITEFDLVTNGDEQLEADYLRDVLIVCYSHPAYTGFLTWGFWEGAHWKPQAALWRKDWSEKPAAAVWKHWVNQEWATSAQGTTGADATWTVNTAHLGRYEVSVTSGGHTAKMDFQLTKPANEVTLRLPPE